MEELPIVVVKVKSDTATIMANMVRNGINIPEQVQIVTLLQNSSNLNES